MLAASERLAVTFGLSPGNEHDAAEGRKLLGSIGKSLGKCSVIMDRAYEGDETRKFVRKLGYKPVVPPKQNRVVPWKYSKKQYKKRNEVERLFRNIKEFRRVFTRYDKLDVMFMGFVMFGLIEIEKIARSVVYKCLHEAIQQLYSGGASKEQAEVIIDESCREVVGSNDITYFLDEMRYREPLESKESLVKYLQDIGI